MQWIKTHLNLVITIAIGVLGITGVVLGIFMSDVAAAMQQDQGTLSSLGSSKGSNSDAIEQARKYSDDVKGRLEKALKDFESIGNHQPLLADVFPNLGKDTAAPFHFKPAYIKALQQMMEKLHAIEAPDQNAFKQEQDAIDDEKAKQERASKFGTDKAAAAPLRPGVRAPVQRVLPAPVQVPVVKPMEAMTPEELARENAQVRASIRRAHKGYCYASLGERSALSMSPAASSFVMPDLLTKDEAPSLETMWYAQMILWIEQDVVNALSAVNAGVAEKLPAGETAWVGNLPVKHLVRINVGGYMPPTVMTGPSSGASSVSGPAFTSRPSANGVDVIQFNLDLYVNPQYLPAVLNEISKAGFYTPLLVNYDAISPTTGLVGYIYGSQPVIHATIQFEGCFLRAKYEKWMPTTVQAAIQEGRAGLGVQAGSAAPTGGLPGGLPGGPPIGGL